MSPYRAPWWLHGRHADTIVAKLFQPPRPRYRRELRPDSSGTTQVAYDFVDGGRPLVVLFTGLEGSSDSHYARALMAAVLRRGWSGVVAHYRGCGGVENTAPLAYHAGDSAEVAQVLASLNAEIRPCYAVGVSLGGNMLAKYLGERGAAAPLIAAAVVSAPLDLAASARSMAESWLSSQLYSPYFLPALCRQARQIARHYPELGLDPELHVRRLPEFDRRVTVPLYHFDSLDDYYRRASALPLLPQIARPTLMINAQNDPLLRAEFLPQHASPAVTLLQPARGGHVGFVQAWRRIDWLPETILDFFTAAAP